MAAEDIYGFLSDIAEKTIGRGIPAMTESVGSRLNPFSDSISYDDATRRQELAQALYHVNNPTASSAVSGAVGVGGWAGGSALGAQLGRVHPVLGGIGGIAGGIVGMYAPDLISNDLNQEYEQAIKERFRPTAMPTQRISQADDDAYAMNKLNEELESNLARETQGQALYKLLGEDEFHGLTGEGKGSYTKLQANPNYLKNLLGEEYVDGMDRQKRAEEAKISLDRAKTLEPLAKIAELSRAQGEKTDDAALIKKGIALGIFNEKSITPEMKAILMKSAKDQQKQEEQAMQEQDESSDWFDVGTKVAGTALVAYLLNLLKIAGAAKGTATAQAGAGAAKGTATAQAGAGAAKTASSAEAQILDKINKLKNQSSSAIRKAQTAKSLPKSSKEVIKLEDFKLGEGKTVNLKDFIKENFLRSKRKGLPDIDIEKEISKAISKGLPAPEARKLIEYFPKV